MKKQNKENLATAFGTAVIVFGTLNATGWYVLLGVAALLAWGATLIRFHRNRLRAQVKAWEAEMAAREAIWNGDPIFYTIGRGGGGATEWTVSTNQWSRTTAGEV